MDKLRITGGRGLAGEVAIAGAKNAALPALAACLLSGETIELENLPRVRDVTTMLRVLEQLGATAIEVGERHWRIRVERLASFEAPYELVKTMRASVLALGPLLARHGRARVSLPGGCAIGARPIDLHLAGLARLGAELTLQHGYVEAKAPRLVGARVEFPIASVTGTENLMMAAALARGTTVLINAACEPEIVDLALLLNAMGASIHGAGTPEIVIEGRDALGGARHRVMTDRIEAGTYLVAGALAGEDVLVRGACPETLAAVLEPLRAAGVPIETVSGGLRIRRSPRLAPVDVVTAPHPGFPTDMQAQYLALMTQAHGQSRITESVFEHRFMHVAELARMGARIAVDGRVALVDGPAPLYGAQVMATDLRASASLVIAALVARGTTVLDRVYHLDRGYEAMEQKLRALGADVERIR